MGEGEKRNQYEGRTSCILEVTKKKQGGGRDQGGAMGKGGVWGDVEARQGLDAEKRGESEKP